ncbi:MAG TPA: TonB-dependent receptor [Rhizomicrobium sp.]|nr:TonB-dependent receptor [Rhizomicrobium sp.]
MPIDYQVSATTSADWTFWNTREQYAFGELAYHLSGDWTVKGVVTYHQFDERARLLYASNYPDQDTGLGLNAMSGMYPSRDDQYMFDLYASGSVTLFGRQHELVFGANAAQSYLDEYESFHDGELDYPAVDLWGKEQIALPDYPDPYHAAHVSDRQYRFYAAAHINFSDSLKGIAGFDVIKLLSKGISYGVDQRRDSYNVSPYAGLVWSLTSNLNAYASYTNIFNPQSDVDINHQRLAPATGNSYEGGLKTQWFDGRLIATAAVFRAEQLGLAQYAGTFDDGKSYSTGVDTFVTGYEFEIGGAISDDWTVNAGWTELKIKGSDGQDVSGYVPRQSFKLSTVYTMPELRDLKLGGSVRWQSSIYTDDLIRFRQEAYAVLDFLVGIRVVDGLRATLNVNNVTDEKYLGSLKWNQAYYAAPRSFTVGLNYAY